MTLLTVAEYRRFDAASDLEDDALQLVLDAAEADIVDACGPHDAAVAEFPGGDRYLILQQEAASITTITETSVAGSVTTLAANDYRLSLAGALIERLNTGTNRRSTWLEGRVTVTFVPVDQYAQRCIAQRSLVDLALRYQPGVVATTVGSWTEQYGQATDAYPELHAAILATLSGGPRMAVIG